MISIAGEKVATSLYEESGNTVNAAHIVVCDQ
jgi:hypothetical protein